MLTTEENSVVGQMENGNRINRRAVAAWISWGGQTIASICWIISVFFYGIEGTGDILQLCAASAWFIANMFTIPNNDAD